MAAPSIKKTSQELTALADDPAQLAASAGQSLLALALGSRSAALIAQAAKLIAEHRLVAHAAALGQAFQALLAGPARAALADPAALAKVAVIEALDAIEAGDAELFAQAASCVQLERTKAGSRDVAAPLRARAVLALARTGHRDFLPILGAALGDRDAGVRLSAARALAHRELRDGAGLLLMRLMIGDDTPEVFAQCVRGLFSVGPDLAERYVRGALQNAQPELREPLLHALGTSNHDAAVELLEGELAQHAMADEREPIIAALGLSRRPRARELLLSLVSGERASDAAAALSALAIHRYDARLAAQLRELSAPSRELSRRVRELFGA